MTDIFIRIRVFVSDSIAMSLQYILVGHYEAFSLIKDVENGVKAWDILMRRYDRRVFNEGTTRADDIHKLLEVTLDSIKVGAFNTFISKYEDIASYVKLNDSRLTSKTKYDFLLRAIKYKSYGVFLTKAKTRSPPYNMKILFMLCKFMLLRLKENISLPVNPMIHDPWHMLRRSTIFQ